MQIPEHVRGGSPRVRIEAAFSAAIDQIATVMGEEFEPKPFVTIEEDSEFCALVEPDGNGFCIKISTGVVQAIDDLWATGWNDGELLQWEKKRISDDRDSLAHTSLVWLILHELMHIRLDHLELTGGAALVETKSARKFSLVSHDMLTPTLIDNLDADDAAIAPLCLELQADNDATDILLEVYSDERWDVLRQRAACIFALIVLIEREDEKSDSHGKTHPKAATRLFVLMGHLFQMWLYPTAELEATDVGSLLKTEDRMSPEMFQEYAARVLGPAVNDAVILAMAGNAETFLRDMQGQGEFLKDLYTVQYAAELSVDDIHTEAAKEWLKLMPVNERILVMMGYRE